MATKHATKKQLKEELLKSTSSGWGLVICNSEYNCAFCATYGGTPYAAQFRNLYIMGTSALLIPKLLDEESTLTGKQLDEHAYRQGWHKKKQRFSVLPMTQDFVMQLALKRYADTMKFASPNSADKMLELMAKHTGVGMNVKVDVSGTVTWEQEVKKQVASKGNREDRIITLDDADYIAELPEDDDESLGPLQIAHGATNQPATTD